MKLPPLPSAAQFRNGPKRPLSGEPESTVARFSETPSERDAKRLADMRAALKRLRELPSARESAAIQRLNKAQQLLQQIRALKQAIALATPEQAKALAAQLRQLAGQLASLGKGGDGGLSLPNTASTSGEGSQSGDSATVATTESATAATTVPEAFATLEATVSTEGAANSNGQAPAASGDEANPALATDNEGTPEAARAGADEATRADSPFSDENKTKEALRNVLKEAWAELKSAAAMLKAKMQLLTHADRARVEEHLRAIDTLASQAGVGGTYVSFGEPSIPSLIDVKA